MNLSLNKQGGYRQLPGGINTSGLSAGGGALNLTNILKANLLDDDGLEDMHFYFVAFSNHKRKLLKIKEQKALQE